MPGDVFDGPDPRHDPTALLKAIDAVLDSSHAFAHGTAQMDAVAAWVLADVLQHSGCQRFDVSLVFFAACGWRG